MKVSYYICVAAGLNNFSYASKYIRVRDSNFTGKGIYLNVNHELECISDSYFKEDDNKLSVMDVRCIYSSADGSVIAGNEYGVFKVSTDGEYYIFTEKFRYMYFPKNWFLTYQEWSDIPSDKRQAYYNEHYEYNKMLDKTTTKKESREEEAKKEKERKEFKEKIDVINTVSRTIAQNTGVSITTTISKIPKYVYFMLLWITVFEVLVGLYMKNSLFFIVAFWTFITFLVGKKKKEVVLDKEIKVDLQNYERLTAMNKLPLTMLGKIQQLQNYMTIMRYRQVSEDIILLVEQSINLTVFTTIQDDYYSSNKEEINERLNEFLDNTLEYVKTSLQNKDMEIYQIKKNLSEDYLQMIEKNSKMFKSITKDLGQLSNVFEEKKEEETEN